MTFHCYAQEANHSILFRGQIFSWLCIYVHKTLLHLHEFSLVCCRRIISGSNKIPHLAQPAVPRPCFEVGSNLTLSTTGGREAHLRLPVSSHSPQDDAPSRPLDGVLEAQDQALISCHLLLVFHHSLFLMAGVSCVAGCHCSPDTWFS